MHRVVQTGQPPTLQELNDWLDQARTILSNLLFEIDDTELQVNPRIKVGYNVKIGCFENELFKAQIEVRRAKRKLALAQAQANRSDAVVDAKLEESLQEEFAQWEAELSARVNEYMQNLEVRASSRALSARDSRELKKGTEHSSDASIPMRTLDMRRNASAFSFWRKPPTSMAIWGS